MSMAKKNAEAVKVRILGRRLFSDLQLWIELFL
jgi:hypothetical protein